MKSLGAFVVLVLCCAVPEAQTLTELAKKEKERRKANAEAGKKASLDAEGGGISPEERRRQTEMERPPTRAELILNLEEKADDLEREREREVRECKKEMRERGYKTIRDHLPSCAELREIHEERNDLLRVIQELKAGR